MKVRTTVKITNDKLPALRREVRKLANPAVAPPVNLVAELRAQAQEIAKAEGLDTEEVFGHLCRIERIKSRLGPKANDLAIARELAAELGVSLEELLEASGVETDGGG